MKGEGKEGKRENEKERERETSITCCPVPQPGIKPTAYIYIWAGTNLQPLGVQDDTPTEQPGQALTSFLFNFFYLFLKEEMLKNYGQLCLGLVKNVKIFFHVQQNYQYIKNLELGILIT